MSGSLRRLLLLSGAVVFLDTVFFAAVTPLLPSYVEQFGLSKAGAGVLTGAYPAGTLVAALPAIWVAGRFGVRRTVLLGLLGLGASSVTFGLATDALTLDLARFAQGLSGALSWAGAFGWLVGAAPAERRGEIIGLALGAALGGALFGPVLGGVAAEVGPPWVFATVGIFSLLLVGATLSLPGPAVSRRPGLAQVRPALGDGRVRLGLWLVLVFGLCFGAIETLGPLQLDAAGVGGTGIALTFLVAVGIEMALSPFVGRITDRRGRLAPVRLCLPLAIVLLLAIGWTTAAWTLIALILLCALALGPLWAPGAALFSDGSEAVGVDQIVTSALSNFAWSIGGLIGAAGGGSVAALAGDPLPYSVLGLVCAGTLGWVLASRVDPGRDSPALRLPARP